MNQLSTLDLLLAAPRVMKDGQSKRGYEAGLTHAAARKERMQQMRPLLRELLLERLSFVEMARKLPYTEMTIARYVRADPELKSMADTYIQRGGYRHGKKRQKT